MEGQSVTLFNPSVSVSDDEHHTHLNVDSHVCVSAAAANNNWVRQGVAAFRLDTDMKQEELAEGGRGGQLLYLREGRRQLDTGAEHQGN